MVDHWEVNGSSRPIWANSYAKGFYDHMEDDNFSGSERGSIPVITKNYNSNKVYNIKWHDDEEWHETMIWGEDLLSAKIFPLSIEELENYLGAGTDATNNPNKNFVAKNPSGMSSTVWSLRSYYSNYIPSNIFVSNMAQVGLDGHISAVYRSGPNEGDYDFTTHMRPAFNIDHKKVLFSMAGNVKKSESQVLEVIADSAQNIGSEEHPWRFTMIDDGMVVIPGNAVINRDKDAKITLPSLTVSSTSYNRISAFVTDKEWKEGNSEGAQILYYGKLDKDNGFVLPEALKDKKAGTDYHVYVTAEYVDGEFASDSASKPVEVDIKNAKDHVHKFAEEWSSDDKYHWHVCTAEGALDSCLEEAGSAKGEHTYRNGLCTVCSYACKHPGVEKGLCPICGYDLDADREVVEDAVTATPDITETTTELYLIKGQKFNLPEAGYTSTDSKYLTVSKKGAVTAKKITEVGKELAIKNDKRSISINISQPTIAKKKSVEAGGTITADLKYDAEHLEVLWVSSAPDVAAVSKDGQIKGISKGKATITAYINGKAFKCTVTVKESTPALTRTVHMNVGSTKKISIKGLKKYEWTVVSGNGAEPRKGGKIYAQEAGELKLKTEKDGKTYEALVYVEDPTITSEKITSTGTNKYSMLMKPGDKVKLKFMNMEQRVLFKSSKTAVAYDNGMGVIKAKKAGKTTLKAKINGKTVTIKVEVQK